MAFVLIYFATMLFSISAPDCFEDVVLTTGFPHLPLSPSSTQSHSHSHPPTLARTLLPALSRSRSLSLSLSLSRSLSLSLARAGPALRQGETCSAYYRGTSLTTIAPPPRTTTGP